MSYEVQHPLESSFTTQEEVFKHSFSTESLYFFNFLEMSFLLSNINTHTEFLRVREYLYKTSFLCHYVRNRSLLRGHIS